MAAYVIVQVEVTDPDRYEAYKRLSQDAVARYGGRFLARGGQVSPLEGEWQVSRLVVLEFGSLAQAEQWYHSPEYQRARAARQGAARMRMIAVEGV